MRRHAAPSVKLTYDDFVRFPDDGKRHEIIDGEHYVTPLPNTKHQYVSGNLFGLLWTFLDRNPVGQVFHAAFDVVFSNLDIVEPDLLYVSRQRLDILTETHVRGVPDIVVEILSPGTKRTDERVKRDLYERFGVREYWIVNPALDLITVYRRHDLALVMAGELTAAREDVLATPLLPGWSAPLMRIFAAPLSAA